MARKTRRSRDAQKSPNLSRRPRRLSPPMRHKTSAATRARKRRWQRRYRREHRAEYNRKQADLMRRRYELQRAAEQDKTLALHREGLSIVSTPGRTPLLWIDPHGTMHREQELSAEELIRRWKKEHRP